MNSKRILVVHSKKMMKKRPQFGAISRLNMTTRLETTKPQPRLERSVVKGTEEPSLQFCYRTFTEFCQRLARLKSLSNWHIGTFLARVVLKQMMEPYLLPKFEILVDDSLGFNVKVYGCYLPGDHPVYLDYRRTVRNVTMSRLVKGLEDSYSLCCGVNVFNVYFPTNFTSRLFRFGPVQSHTA